MKKVFAHLAPVFRFLQVFFWFFSLFIFLLIPLRSTVPLWVEKKNSLLRIPAALLLSWKNKKLIWKCEDAVFANVWKQKQEFYKVVHKKKKWIQIRSPKGRKNVTSLLSITHRRWNRRLFLRHQGQAILGPSHGHSRQGRRARKAATAHRRATPTFYHLRRKCRVFVQQTGWGNSNEYCRWRDGFGRGQLHAGPYAIRRLGGEWSVLWFLKIKTKKRLTHTHTQLHKIFWVSWGVGVSFFWQLFHIRCCSCCFPTVSRKDKQKRKLLRTSVWSFVRPRCKRVEPNFHSLDFIHKNKATRTQWMLFEPPLNFRSLIPWLA